MLGRPRSEKTRLEIMRAAYRLLKRKGLVAVNAHEIAQAAKVSTATLYRWWGSKEEIMLDACLEQVKPTLIFTDEASPLTSLRKFFLRAPDFLGSADGKVMASLITGIHDDETLRRLYLERFYLPRRKAQRQVIEQAVAAGELRSDTDPELLMDLLNGPLFFRWLQGHAPVTKQFSRELLDAVLPAFATQSAAERKVGL
jgi:AcrR family transcriptional regulator